MKDRLSIHIKDAHSDKQVLAEALTISDTGVFVDTPMVFAVNSDVVCEFTDDAEVLSLQGKVNWRHCGAEIQSGNNGEGRERQDTQTLVGLGDAQNIKVQPSASLPGGMGIGFNCLSEEQKRLLQRLKARIDMKTTSVRLWFTGVKDPVCAQGMPTYNGLVLETQLPFLQLKSSVSFQLGEDQPFYEGKLSNVEIDTNNQGAVPLLRVGMELNANKEPTQRMYILDEIGGSGKEREEPSFDGDSFQKAVHGEEAERDVVEQREPQPARRIDSGKGNVWTYALIATIAGLVGALVTWAIADKSPAEMPSSKGELNRDRKTEVAVMEKGKKENRAQSKPERSVKKAQQPQPDTQTTPVSKEIGIRDSKINLDEKAVSAAKPQITVQEDSTRVWVPLSGSDEDMREYRLSTPGITINLPEAQSKIPFANYGVHQGLVKRVWVRPFRSGTQVRVITAWASVRHQIEFTSDGLEVNLNP